ncbi:MAG: NADH-quinone oxidoreductase subunit C [Bacteroidales bacterium]|nr:MAG: NADH-quinone oxidoreductase subunit C [Bacteroidales bacterium]
METSTQYIIKDLHEKFGPDIDDVKVNSERRATVTITGKSLVKFCEHLFNDLHFRFIIASALESRRGIEIYYHFSNDPTGLVLNIHVILSREKPEIESLTGLFEASNWIEREMHEILGINFLNHPNLEKLISEGNWAEGVYPYRKEEL